MLQKVDPKVDFVELEHKILKFWADSDIFKKRSELNRGNEKWSFIDGPITANNPMGVHHAWGRTYKDLFLRYKAMQGYDLRFQNGFDCQGLWVEVEVEKEMGFESKKDIEEYGIDAFVNKCKERVLRYSAVQTQQSIRLGYWMDWNDLDQLEMLADGIVNQPQKEITVEGPNGPVTDTIEGIVGRLGMPELGGSYYTFSNENNYMIWRVIKNCHDNGWLYRGADSMPWCPRCATGISQHEIVTDGYEEITHRSVYVKFPLRERKNESLLIWTTTPWTLTSNVAAAVGPELDYVKVQMTETGECLILSKGATSVIQGDYSVKQEFKGAEMVGWRYDGPFDELPAQKAPGGWTELNDIIRDINVSSKESHQVIPWDEVAEDEGTGIVHIAPGAGSEDFGLGKEFKLPVIAPLDEEGKIIDGFDWLTGMSVSEVARPIFDNLKEKGLMFRIENYTHRYPTCWRCKTELVFRLVDEWFISMDQLRPLLMDITRKIHWIPGFGMERELDWLKNMQDWMISKKRYWGLALPIWECNKCDNWTVIGDDEEMKEQAVSGYDQFTGHTPHRPWLDCVKIACEKCGSKMNRVPDVGNPWLDAGIVSFSTLRYRSDPDYWKEWYPGDWISESFPGQFRNWFYSMLVMGAIMDKSPSFKSNFGYATLMADDGREMHKSWGNSIEFNEAADKMGVDVMRWMYAIQNPEKNLLFGYGAAKEIRRRLITLWNVYSFFVTYAKLDQFDSSVEVDQKDLTQLDRWITCKMDKMILTAVGAYDCYRVDRFMKQLDRFLDNLSNWYVRRNRRRFWKSENDIDKNAAYFTLYSVLKKLILILAPVAPFVTERIYQNLVRSLDPDAAESIHLNSFPTASEDEIDEKLIHEMDSVVKTVEMGRHARNRASLKIRQPLQKLLFSTDDETVATAILSNRDQIIEELNVKSVERASSFSDLVIRNIAPNYPTLGEKYGDGLKDITAWLNEKSYEEITNQMRGSGIFTISSNGKEFELMKEDLIINETSLEGKSAVSDSDLTVAVETDLSEELIQEGYVRDIVRHVQSMRKEAEFNVEDRITVVCFAENGVGEAIKKFEGYFRTEVLAVELIFGKVSGELTKEISVGGEVVSFGISRAKN
ncbi:MAG: class I tRNA ligase family protein [Candidatus Neomarinimicrobiota bacterium]|nr:class I tRNA ligase family protein [Candidatus Neomarinimicrobiota bacterium]